MLDNNRFIALDGMRGLAALFVLLFHLGQWQHRPMLAANAIFAVDLFFILSGYVLAFAYSRKLDAGMSPWRFFVLRLLRLMPLTIFATLISAAYLFTRIYWLDDVQVQPADLLVATVLGVLCLPMLSMNFPIGGPQVFPLNGPQYTLFLELFINLFWALVHPSRKIAVAAVLAATGYAFTAVYGMGGDTIENFWTGFPRVFGAFYAGTLIFYTQQSSSFLNHEWLGILFWPLLSLTFVLFWWPHEVSPWIGWGWSLLFAPLLVLTGSRVRLGVSARRIALLLGELSYPIYTLHYPIFVWVNATYQTVLQRKDFSIGNALIIPCVVIGAWLALKWVDGPVRIGIKARIFRRTVSRPAA